MQVLMNVPVETAIRTRYSLLSRLQNWDDEDSWKDFFDTYWRLIYSLALKSGLTDAEAQDVVQETVISVAKHIHKFERDRSRGKFKGWLRNIIRWRIADQLKKRTPDWEKLPRADELGEPEPDDIPDPGGTGLEAQWEEEWQANLLKAAIERVKRRVKEEQYLVFDLYVVKGWPVLKVARRLGINVGQVYLAKHRISALVRKEIEALEEKPF